MAKKKEKKIKKTQEKQLDEKEILLQANNRMHRDKAVNLFNSAYQAREKYDWEWLTRDLFRRGYQFSTYDNRSRTVLLASRKAVKFPINMLWAQMRSVKNQVTNFKPKWEVLPSGKTEEAVNNAKYSGRLLDYYYGRLGLRKMLKETVMQGLLYSVGGPWQIGYDPGADNGNGEVYIWLLDTFDFYVDPHATSLKEAEYCIKAVRKTLKEVTTNPNFEFYATIPTKGEASLAASPSKQFLLQTLKTRVGTGMEDEEEGAILKEAWIKVRVSEETLEDLKEELIKNEEDAKDLKEGDVIMRIVHYVDFVNGPLRVQLKRTSEFPFVMYQADINPLELYGESWAKHIIPINRVLNALESSIFTYNYKYAVGRIVVDKNSGVRNISNQHGSFIEKNRGSEVSSLPLQPLPSSYQNQVQNCWKYIEDLGGSHDVSQGRIPTAITSGIAIAELKQADSTNQSDLVDNLEDFLVEVGKKILKEVAENYDVPKVVKDLGYGGEAKHFAAVGEGGAGRRKNKKLVKIGVDNFDLAIIGADNEIRVTVGSWLAYTKTARQERIKELFSAGLIDPKTALKHLEFSDIDNIIENVRKEDTLKQFRTQGPQGEEVSGEEIARQENIMMQQEGREVEPLVTDNHTVHNIIHQEALGFGGNPLVEKHMELHDSLVNKAPVAGQPNTGSQMSAPVAPPMTGALQPQGQPQMPEEAALARTMEEMGGI